MLQTPLWGLDVEELTYISLIWVKTKLILLVVVFANPERSCIIHLYFKANTLLLGKKKHANKQIPFTPLGRRLDHVEINRIFGWKLPQCPNFTCLHRHVLLVICLSRWVMDGA